MSNFKAEWKAAKLLWDKAGATTLEKPTLEQMKKLGWDKLDLGKKLGVLDAAKELDKRRAAMAPVSLVIEKYQLALKKGIDLTKDSKAETGLKKLRVALGEILKEANASVQDPEPSGRAEELLLVAVQNAAGGVRTEWLQVGAIDIKSYLVVDAEVMRLEKAGELGYRWTELQKACADVVAQSSKAFAETIKVLDEKIGQMAREARTPSDAKAIEAKKTEANEVLRHYAKIVERNTNAVVDKYWQRALARQAYLKNFKSECKTDVAMSGVAIAVSAVSIAMTFGAAALSAAVIAKSVMDIGITLAKYYRSATEVEAVLAGHMKDVRKIYEQRVAAKAKGEGQKASKAGQMGKEAIASALGPISASLLTTTSRTLKEAKEYLGKLSETEAEAGKMWKQLNDFTSQFPSAPEGPDARSNAEMRALHNNFKAMNKQYQDFINSLRDNDIAWGERCEEICENLKKEDYLPDWTQKAGTTTKALIALASLAKLGVQLAAKLA